MNPGDRHDDDTEEARLRRVEGEAVVLGARVGALEGAVSGLRTEVDAMRIELSTTLGRVERDVTALRAEEAERHAEARESLHWRRGMMRDACGGAVALVRLGVERFSQPSTLWPIVALVGILAAAGYGVVKVGGNGYNTPDVLGAAGAATDGMIVSASWNPGRRDARSRAFVRAYRAAYGNTPSAFAAQGYAGVQLLEAAAGRGRGGDPASVLAGLRAVRSVPSVLGTMRFTKGVREAVYPATVQQVRGGRLLLAPRG
jgi:hypothetical protein